MEEFASVVVLNAFRETVREVIQYHAESKCHIETVQSGNCGGVFRDTNEAGFEMVGSVISLDGEDFRCTLSLVASTETIRSLCPVQGTCPRDWVGELANLLMGGLKNKLIEYEVSPKLGLPMSVRGLELCFIDQASSYHTELVDVANGPIVISLHDQISSTLTWNHNPALAAASEGDVCLF